MHRLSEGFLSVLEQEPYNHLEIWSKPRESGTNKRKSKIQCFVPTELRMYDGAVIPLRCNCIFLRKLRQNFNRGRVDDLVDDVFKFMRDRYFVGEEINFVEDRKKKRARVLAVQYIDPSSPAETSNLGNNNNCNNSSDNPATTAVENGIKTEADEQRCGFE